MKNFNFATEFTETVSDMYPNGIEWGIVGILTKNGTVYTLSFDSKILSGIFEIFCEPIIQSIASENNLIVKKSIPYLDFHCQNLKSILIEFPIEKQKK